jgi:polyisoprenoid-binding protein YceI
MTDDLTGTWDIDASHSTLGFAVRHAMVATVRGHFSGFSGSATLDATNPAGTTTTVSIDAATIDTANAQRDEHVRAADFLDVVTYPQITFVGTSTRPGTGDGSWVLTGDLTIRDQTRPIDIAFTALGTSVDPFGNTRAGFEGTAQISRKEWGLTWNAALETGGVLVGDTVKLTIDISAIKAPTE